MELLEMFKRMLPTAEDRSFKSSVFRETLVLITLIFVDMITSVIMMRIRGVQLERNVLFGELYLNPTLQNAFNFICGQWIYVTTIVTGIAFAELSSTSVLQNKFFKPVVRSTISYTVHLLLIPFAFLRMYGAYTNIAGILIDFRGSFLAVTLPSFFIIGSLLIIRFTLCSNIHAALLKDTVNPNTDLLRRESL
jgi:cytosine/uracil/thiamine/allantoin permease